VNFAGKQAGEERFSIELDENNQVWYEILSFSKPAHFLAFIGFPYVLLRQKYFARQSTNAVLKQLTGINVNAIVNSNLTKASCLLCI
jgi:hypothetical protein